MKPILFILTCLLMLSCQQGDFEAKFNAANAKLVLTEKALADAKATQVKPGLIHSVFFWLKEDATKAEIATFKKGLNNLGTIETVKSMYISPPAATDARGVVDNSYSYALIVHFDDIAGHDIYQKHATHLKFIEESEGVWTKVIVYDSTAE